MLVGASSRKEAKFLAGLLWQIGEEAGAKLETEALEPGIGRLIAGFS